MGTNLLTCSAPLACAGGVGRASLAGSLACSVEYERVGALESCGRPRTARLGVNLRNQPGARGDSSARERPRRSKTVAAYNFCSHGVLGGLIVPSFRHEVHKELPRVDAPVQKLGARALCHVRHVVASEQLNLAKGPRSAGQLDAGKWRARGGRGWAHRLRHWKAPGRCLLRALCMRPRSSLGCAPPRRPHTAAP